MKKNNTNWNSIFFVILLITLTLSLWVLVINKQNYFEKSTQIKNIENILSQNIIFDSSNYINTFLSVNKKTEFYKPILWCPLDIKYFSWSELIWSWNTSLDETNKTCTWSIDLKDLVLNYSLSYLDFLTWSLDLTWFTLNKTWTWYDWSIWDKTITFENPKINTNYISQKIQKSWIILKNTWYQNIFWSNDKINYFIDEDLANIEPLKKLWNTSSWTLYFDINWSFSWKIIEFDKNIFNNSNKLVKISENYFFSNSWAIWYLQDDKSINSNTWTALKLDFTNKDYAIFLSYNSWVLDNIRYSLNIYNDDNLVYINPIKYLNEKIDYLANIIIINKNNFYYKLKNITKNK